MHGYAIFCRTELEHVAHILLKHPRMYTRVRVSIWWDQTAKRVLEVLPAPSFYLTFGRAAPPSSVEKSCWAYYDNYTKIIIVQGQSVHYYYASIFLWLLVHATSLVQVGRDSFLRTKAPLISRNINLLLLSYQYSNHYHNLVLVHCKHACIAL